MESEGREDHPYVAHYDGPDEPDAEADRRDAEALAQAAHDSARQLDFARWRALRYVAGIFLACASIAGGAVALLAVVMLLGSGTGPLDLVTAIDESGERTVSLTNGQWLMLVGVLVALEVVLIWAATLLFSKGLHPGQWVAVGVLAAASTVGVLVGGSSLSVSAADWPYLAAFPLIVVAALLESLRIRGLRARWGR